MKEKNKTIIKIILVIILLIGTLVFKSIPEYKETQGSSDSYIDIESYTDIIEIKINNKPNFALVITEKSISNILFFDVESLCLYNKNIEEKNITEGSKDIVKYLIENDYLKQNSVIVFTKYKDLAYNEVKKNIMETIKSFDIDVNLKEQKMTIAEKAIELNVTGNDEQEQLESIELLSKDIVRYSKNDVSGKIDTPKIPTISKDNSREYTDNIYTKIELYARKNNIVNQSKESETLIITEIPANNTGTLFPNQESWYYIENGKVYAYISITEKGEKYSYCYQGYIDNYKEGQCP